MSAYLLECLIEAHGHRVLCTHLARPRFWQNFAAAIGCRESEPAALLALCQRAVLPRDQKRLRLFIDGPAGQIGDAEGMRVFVPRENEAEPNQILVRSQAPTEMWELRLGAHRALSTQHQAGPLFPLAHLPVLGARTRFALSLLADWIAEPSQLHPLAFAFGDHSGSPSPILVRVYDQTLRTLESLLGARHPPTSRLEPLWMLHEQRKQLEAVAHPQKISQWRQRELKMARNLCGFDAQGAVGHDAPLPRLWRRPQFDFELPTHPDPDPLQRAQQGAETLVLDDLFLP